MIETQRLLIRPGIESDAEPLHVIHSDPDVTRWLGGAMPASVQEERDRIVRLNSLEDQHGFTMWTVEEKDTGAVIGKAGLFPVEMKGPDVEVAYHFAKDRWGRGYATESAQACLDYGFDALGLTEIVGLVVPDNAASARVLQKCGMRPVGPAHHYDMDLLKYRVERPKAG